MLELSFGGIILVFLLSYFAGSIPTAYIVGKKIKHMDIRTVGSGNVGSTNALRMVGKKGAAIVLVVDFLKGFLPALICTYLYGLNIGAIAGLSSVAGHVFPVWLKFRGGKGAATGIGFVLATVPFAFVPIMIVWAITLLVSGYVSLGTVVATVTAAIYFIVSAQPPGYTIFALIGMLLVIYKHKNNIIRILHGEEHRFIYKNKK